MSKQERNDRRQGYDYGHGGEQVDFAEYSEAFRQGYAEGKATYEREAEALREREEWEAADIKTKLEILYSKVFR